MVRSLFSYDPTVRCLTVRCGAVRSGAVRCDAVRGGAVLLEEIPYGALRCGTVKSMRLLRTYSTHKEEGSHDKMPVK